MLYPSLADLLDHVSNRYMLVNIIARRARELSGGFNEYDDLADKPVSRAIDEIAVGDLRISFTDES